MPSAAELARSECLSVVLIYKLATLVVRNPREASCACLPRDLLLQALPIKFHLIPDTPKTSATFSVKKATICAEFFVLRNSAALVACASKLAPTRWHEFWYFLSA